MTTSRGTTVLSVSGEPDAADSIEMQLARIDEGAMVLSATTPDEALSLLAEAAVDCIVADYSLPEGDGLELLELVRARNSTLPFIIVTEDDDTEIPDDALSAGATHLLHDGGREQYQTVVERIEAAVDTGDSATNIDQLDAETRYRSLFENNPIVIWEHDFSDAKQYVDELTAKEGDLRNYLGENPEELGHIMERVNIIDVNQNAVEYYQADSKQHLIENLDAVMADEAWELTVDLWTEIAAGGTRFRGETVARTFQGDRRDQILELYVPDAYAADYSRVYLGTDITERREYERELDQQTQRLEAFMDALAHDIPNHLLVASGSLELARETGADEHFDRLVTAHDRIKTHVEQLKSLLRTGSEATGTEWVDFTSIVEQCWQSCFVHEDTEALDIRDGGRISADRNRLTQLFENLFWNVREHAGGNVTVEIGVFEGGFYVSDDGSGIPDAEHRTVFEPGYTTEEDHHTGFGLAIVREIATAHDWDVNLTTSENGGTQFEFTNVVTELR